VFYNSAPFMERAVEIFGKRTNDALEILVGGGVVWTGPGGQRPWLGLERYRHGLDAYAVCRQGNFPDRRWDVAPIVGFWSPHPDAPALTKARSLHREKMDRNAEQLLCKEAADDLTVWNQFVQGDVWGYQATLLDADGNEIAEDSCWGYFGLDRVEQEAEALVQHWRKKYEKETV